MWTKLLFYLFLEKQSKAIQAVVLKSQNENMSEHK